MRYSVYDYTRRVYDYYDAPGPDGSHAGSPPMSETSSSEIGASPDAAAWRLPIGASKVGSGQFPQGRIASLSGAEWFTSPKHIAVGLLIAYAGWRMFR